MRSAVRPSTYYAILHSCGRVSTEKLRMRLDLRQRHPRKCANGRRGQAV
jgi:hypothetical protein